MSLGTWEPKSGFLGDVRTQMETDFPPESRWNPATANPGTIEFMVGIATGCYNEFIPGGGGGTGQTDTVQGDGTSIQNTGDDVNAVLTAIFGSVAGSICEGNDPRLSDARIPIPTAGADPTAIHEDVAGEIFAIAVKAVPLAADLVLIEDTAAANAKKSTTAGAIAALGGGVDPNAIHDNVAGEIDAIAAKVPVAADELLIEDSGAAWAKKKTTLTDLSAAVIHNSLSGLQGGTAAEYYHLTQAQHTRVTYAYTLWVGAGCDYPNVKAALTAAALLPLSTTQRCIINVLPGLYAEVNPLSSVAWVDVVGLGGDPRDIVIRCTVAGQRLFNWSGAHYMGLSNLTLDGNAVGHTGCYNSIAGGSTFCRNIRAINFTTNGFLFSGVTAELHDIVTSGNLYGIRIGATTTVFGYNIELGDVTSGIYNSGGIFYAWNYYAHNVGNALASDAAASRNYVWGGLFTQNGTAVRHFTASGAESWIHNVRFQNAVTWDLLFSNVGGEIHIIGCTTDPTKWSLGATPGKIFVQDWGSSPYVVKVGSDPEHGFTSIKAAIDYLQTTGLTATQRGRVEIEPGTYTLTAACDLDSYIDVVGRGDVPDAVRIVSALNLDAFQDMGTSTWSLRNLQVTANGTGWCVDANVGGGGGGTLEDVILIGGAGGGVLRAENDITIAGRVILRANATSTSLLTAAGCTILGHGTLELDDAAGSGAGIDTATTGVTVRLAYLDAHSAAATGDGLYLGHADDDVTIWDGRIIGWQDAIHVAASLDMELGPLVVSGGTYDLNPTSALTLRVHGTRYSTAKVSAAGLANLNQYGDTLDQNGIVSRRCYVRDNAGAIALVAGAWTDITWDTAVVEDGGSWDHDPGAAGTAIIELKEASIPGVTINYDVCISREGVSAAEVLYIASRIVRETGGGGYNEVDGTRDYHTIYTTASTTPDVLRSLHRTVIIGAQKAGDRYKLQVYLEAGAVNTYQTVPDASGMVLWRDY